MSLNSKTTQKHAVHSWQMFDRIANTYDLLNRILSFGIDTIWRKKMATFIPKKKHLHLLDLATGTGDQMFSLCRNNRDISSAVGIDMSKEMLAVGREKLLKQGLEQSIEMKHGDAEKIPEESEIFDLVTVSFGIRNVSNVSSALHEMHRVLKPEGRTLILEFSLPKNKIFRSLYLFYFRYILPRIGGVLSGDREAYHYLNRSVEAFPYGDEFCQLMCDAGFQNVRSSSLTFGIASIYQGDK